MGWLKSGINYRCKRVSKDREIIKSKRGLWTWWSPTWHLKIVDKPCWGRVRFQTGRSAWSASWTIVVFWLISLSYWNRLPYMGAGSCVACIPSHSPNLRLSSVILETNHEWNHKHLRPGTASFSFLWPLCWALRGSQIVNWERSVGFPLQLAWEMTTLFLRGQAHGFEAVFPQNLYHCWAFDV